MDPQHVARFKAGDVVEVDSDPEDSDSGYHHVYCGKIIRFNQHRDRRQISIQRADNHLTYTYFQDDIEIHDIARIQTEIAKISDHSELITSSPSPSPSVANQTHFGGFHDLRIMAETIEDNFRTLRMAQMQLKRHGQEMINILCHKPTDADTAANAEAVDLWRKISECAQALLHQMRLVDGMKKTYVQHLIQLLCVMAVYKDSGEVMALQQTMKELNSAQSRFIEQLSNLHRKAIRSMDQVTQTLIGLETIRQIQRSASENKQKYELQDTAFRALKSSIAKKRQFLKQEIDSMEKRTQSLHSELERINSSIVETETTLDVTLRSLQNDSKVKYKILTPAHSTCSTMYCRICKDRICAQEAEAIELFDADTEQRKDIAIHRACYKCSQCNRSLYGGVNYSKAATLIITDANRVYCNLQCSQRSVYEYCAMSERLLQTKQGVRQQISAHRRRAVAYHQEEKICDSELEEKRERLQRVQQRYEKDADELNLATRKTGVSEEKLIDFASRTALILPSVVESCNKINLAAQCIKTSNRMIDDTFGDGGQMRIDKYIRESPQYRDCLSKYIEPLCKDLGLVYMRQLQCDGDKAKFIEDILNPLSVSMRGGAKADVSGAHKIKGLDKRHLTKLSNQNWKEQDEENGEETKRRAAIFADYLERLVDDIFAGSWCRLNRQDVAV